MVQKSKYKSSNNKAYLQIDFAIAIFIFLIFFTIFYNYYVYYKNDINHTNELLELNSISYDICYLITKTTGKPNNWYNDISNSVFLGLKNKNNNTLNFNKITVFNNSNYFLILDKYNISSNLFVNITGLNSNTNYLNFGHPTPLTDNIYSSYKCFSNYNSEIVEIYVEVWE